jgi:hypothetical protein
MNQTPGREAVFNKNGVVSKRTHTREKNYAA